MALPEAQPGLVFRYDYLWNRDAREGRPSGKDRPACIAMTTGIEIDPHVVAILPITHSKPTGKTVGFEIPPLVRRRLGLDDEPCWVIVSEHNIDEWPPPGIAPLPGTKKVFAYGVLPSGLFEKIKKEFLRQFDQARGVRR
ncbi:MAG TPA: hypothetical protein VII56_09185 [Rhizomicrobium sp.]